MNVTIDDVRDFWEDAPLFSGESRHLPGTREFFDEHARTIVEDCFAGRLPEFLFPAGTRDQRALDLGCGPGFWIVEMCRRGIKDVVGADLTKRAIELAAERTRIYGFEAEFAQMNAERLDFPDASFDHVNCQGVIHHTPDPAAAVREIARVLRPGGTATVSVYYRNIFLRMWPVLAPFGRLLHRLGAALPGRGRSKIFALRDTNEIVRLYDGADNPLGIAFSRSGFTELLHPELEVTSTALHFFPARSLPFRIPRRLHRLLDRRCGFMIVATARKPGGA